MFVSCYSIYFFNGIIGKTKKELVKFLVKTTYNNHYLNFSNKTKTVHLEFKI